MANHIHSSAIIDPLAELGDGVSIGPYCIIGPEVVIGSGTELQSHVVIDGRTSVGNHCRIYPFACVGKRTQDLKYRGGQTEVRIGDCTTIREYVTVHQPTTAGALTAVGDGCNLLAYCHVAHDCILGKGIIMSNSVHLAGHVTVEDDAVIGGMSGIHQFVKIGRMAMISATAKVVQDVIPFGLVDGNPASLISINRIGMQRHGKSEESITNVGRAFRTLFRSNLRLEDAIDAVRSEMGDIPDVCDMLDFIAHSERGLVRPRA